ncbi:MAG: aminodeoxychorismate synthase, component I, partial [candidate division NC10 bacterium]|nr:aminodeoxychorismate synthase, component I [candidate division NC10 bacterium]
MLPSDNPFLVIDFCNREGRPRRLGFTNPLDIVVARSVEEVRPALRAVHQAVRAGLYAAGYLSYEA